MDARSDVLRDDRGVQVFELIHPNGDPPQPPRLGRLVLAAFHVLRDRRRLGGLPAAHERDRLDLLLAGTLLLARGCRRRVCPLRVGDKARFAARGSGDGLIHNIIWRAHLFCRDCPHLFTLPRRATTVASLEIGGLARSGSHFVSLCLGLQAGSAR